MKLILVGLMGISLCGCAGIPIGVLYGLEAAAATATIAKDVIGIDVSLKQDDPTKTPVKTLLGGGSAASQQEVEAHRSLEQGNYSLDGK